MTYIKATLSGQLKIKLKMFFIILIEYRRLQADYKNALRVGYTRLKVIMDLIKDLHLSNTE